MISWFKKSALKRTAGIIVVLLLLSVVMVSSGEDKAYDKVIEKNKGVMQNGSVGFIDSDKGKIEIDKLNATSGEDLKLEVTNKLKDKQDYTFAIQIDELRDVYFDKKNGTELINKSVYNISTEITVYPNGTQEYSYVIVNLTNISILTDKWVKADTFIFSYDSKTWLGTTFNSDLNSITDFKINAKTKVFGAKVNYDYMLNTTSKDDILKKETETYIILDPTLDDSLVGYWDMSGVSNMTTDIFGTNDGALSGTTSFRGTSNPISETGGGQYLSLSAGALGTGGFFTISDATNQLVAFDDKIYTLSYWINTTDISGRMVTHAITSAGLGTQCWAQNPFLLEMGASSSVMYRGFTGVRNHINFPGNLSDNKWHNVILTSNATGGFLYIDGKSTGSMPLDTGGCVESSGWNLTFGCNAGADAPNTTQCAGAAPDMDMRLDEVGLWSRGFTQSDASSLYYNGTNGTFCSGDPCSYAVSEESPSPEVLGRPVITLPAADVANSTNNFKVTNVSINHSVAMWLNSVYKGNFTINSTFNFSGVPQEQMLNFTAASWNGSAYGLNESINFTHDNYTATSSYVPYSVANASFINVSYVLINISVNETFNHTFTIHNGTTNWINVNAGGSGSSKYFFYNFTGLTDGNYTFFASVNDTAGNRVVTLNRTVIVDTVAPAISFVANTPANNSYLPRSNIFINTTHNDAGSDHNDYSAFVDFNNSLVGYWRFEDDGDTNATDFSSYGNNGTLVNFGCMGLDCNASSGWVSNGKRGKAVIVDGANDYVDLGNTSLRLLNWTYEFWIKRNTDSGTDEFHLSKSNSTDYDNFLYFTTPDTFICRWTDTAGSDHWATTVSTFTATNTWYYIACTYDSTNVKIYVNGNLDVTSTDFSAFTPRVSSVPLWLGRRANTYTGNRTFDEVKAWNRALSAQEINASFNAGIYRLERNFTGLSDGNYSYRAFVVDAAGNINSTANQTFVTDATFPLINFTANTHLNNTFTNQNWTFINISYSELYGGVFKIHNGTTDTTPNIIAGSFNYNFTNLPDGNYSYFATINDSAGNKNVTKNLTIVVDTLIPSVSGSNFLTTGKISTSPLLLGQTIDWIAATASDLYLMQVNITITGGDGTTPVNNVLMTNDYGSNWNYTSDLTLNSAGNWTVNIKGIDRAGNTFTNSTNFTVNTQNKSTTEGLYGYTDNKVFSTAEITSLSTYKYELLEFSENISNMAGSWGTILAGINESKITSAVVGLNYILDINYSKPSDVTNAMLNISKYFPEIKNSPYITTVQYVSFQIVNDSSYNDSDKYNALNNLAQNATNAFLNQFAIYSKNYNSSNLSTSYIKFTPLLYVTSTTQSDLVTAENNLLRQNRSINRVYVNLSTTLKTQAKSYQDNVIAILRGTPALNANLGNVTIAEIDTAVNDLVVFNNESIDKDMNINASNITGLIGKDVWDATSKKLIANNTNGVFNVNASAYSAVVLYTEDIDHIQLSSLISGKVFKGGINTIKSLNHTDGTRDNNFALDGAKDARITLDNPHYIWNDFRVDYGWLNASPINYSTASPYDLVIFADKNDQEIDKLNFTASDFYHYLSDASYTNSQAWYDSQKAVIDEYFAFNSNIAGSFLNGLDAAMAGANFTSWLQDQVDDVKIARAKKVILNTYTYSENLSTIGDFVMKESCINRWNGADSANPTSYTREDFSLEINKSTFYQNHNIPVLCQAFMNLSSFNQIDNATDMLNIYYGAKVLYGRNAKFNVDKPTFNGVQPIKVPDLGNDLANAPSTDDNVTYYRAFSNGIVYYNSSSTQGRFDDGKEVSSAKLCFDLYDNHATSVTVQFTINREVTGTDAGDYNFSDSELDGVGVWTRKCVELNETHRNLPRYDVQVFVTPRTTIIGQGVAIGNDYILTENKYSWHDSSASPNVWTLYGMGTNWNVNLEINQTSKASIDTVSTITQTEVNSSKHYNLTLSSGFTVNTEVWSNPQTIARTDFINLTYFDGTNYQLLYPSNVSNCDSNNPSWNTTTIGGNPFKSCIETNGSAYTIRVAPYKLSDQLFVTEFLGNTAPEAPTIISPLNATVTNLNRINYSSSDAEGDSITFRIYINGTFNGTAVDANFTFQSSPEKSLAFNVSACDASLCSVNTTGYFMYDNLTPRVNYSMNSDTNNSFKNVNWAFLNYSWADVNNDTAWIIRDGINVTVNMTSTYFFANITGLADGLHVFAGWMNDTAGNVNQTLNTTITIDTTSPWIVFGEGTKANNSFTNTSSVFMNFSWIEVLNHTFAIHNRTTNFVNVNATSNTFFYTFTGLGDGNYSFFGSLNDTLGHRNTTTNRTIVVDTTPPSLSLVSPSSGATLQSATVTFAFNATDTYLNTCTLYVNDAPLTNFSSFTSAQLSSTIVTEGTALTWRASCADAANNTNASPSQPLYFDITLPQGTGASPGTTRSSSSNPLGQEVAGDTYSSEVFLTFNESGATSAPVGNVMIFVPESVAPGSSASFKIIVLDVNQNITNAKLVIVFQASGLFKINDITQSIQGTYIVDFTVDKSAPAGDYDVFITAYHSPGLTRNTTIRIVNPSTSDIVKSGLKSPAVIIIMSLVGVLLLLLFVFAVVKLVKKRRKK